MVCQYLGIDSTQLCRRRLKMATQQVRKRWPKEDEIRWVEWELQRARYGAEWEKSAIGETPLNLEVWLAKVRDEQSWKQIGERFYPKRMRPEARRSEARRAYDRVERYLNDPNANEFQSHRLNQLIKETFGVSAQEFRTYILKGYVPRPRTENQS
jgi:hypothetical protein